MVHKGYLQDFDLFDKMILVNYEIENEHSSNCLHRNLHEIDNYPILIKIKIDVSIYVNVTSIVTLPALFRPFFNGFFP